jgi:hypothetical protein
MESDIFLVFAYFSKDFEYGILSVREKLINEIIFVRFLFHIFLLIKLMKTKGFKRDLLR